MAVHPRLLPFVLSAIAVGACAQATVEPPGRGVHISRELVLVLPRPGDLGHAVEVTQLVTARHGTQSYTFEGHVSATPERFLMVGLDSLGRRAMTITWTDSAITYEAAPWLPPQLRPENILADMVLLYWPVTSAHQAVEASGGAVTATDRRRTVTYDGQTVVEIDYAPAKDGSPWSGHMRYRNLAFEYELEIQSVRSSP
jgi:hypothetical protein